MSDTRFEKSPIGNDYDVFSAIYPFTQQIQDGAVKSLQDNLADQIGCILEIGTGTGETTEVLLGKLGNDLCIKSIDISSQMIAQAKQRLGNNQRLSLICDDVLDVLKVTESETIDGIVSVFTLHNIPQAIRPDIYSEIYRVLKPGGVFVNADKVADDNVETHASQLTEMLVNCVKFKTAFNRPDLMNERIQHYIRDEQKDLKLTVSLQESMLQNSGFHNIGYGKRMATEIIVTAIK